MKGRTEQFILSTRDWPFFSMVGKYQGSADNRVPNWDTAIELASLDAWENFLIDQHNAISEELSQERLQRWNQLIDEIKTLSEPSIQAAEFRVRYLVDEHIRQIRNNLSWCLVHAAIDLEFWGDKPKSLCRAICGYYQRGYFPCGVTEDDQQLVRIF